MSQKREKKLPEGERVISVCDQRHRHLWGKWVVICHFQHRITDPQHLGFSSSAITETHLSSQQDVVIYNYANHVITSRHDPLGDDLCKCAHAVVEKERE